MGPWNWSNFNEEKLFTHKWAPGIGVISTKRNSLVGVLSVMVVIVGNGIGHHSSNLGRGYLRFAFP